MIPNPGTKEAIRAGCTCPVLDNSHGKGYMGQAGVFIYTMGCKIHNHYLKCLNAESNTGTATLANRSAGATATSRPRRGRPSGSRSPRSQPKKTGINKKD